MRRGKGRQTFDNGLSRHLFERRQAAPIADSCWPRSWLSSAGPGNRMWHRETRGASVKVVRTYRRWLNHCSLQIMMFFSIANSDTWPACILPHFLGLARCCSFCLSPFQWQSDFLPAWAHRCPLCLQIWGAREGKNNLNWTFDVIIRNFKAIQGGTIAPPCSGWLESNFEDLCQDYMEHGLNRQMEKMFWVSNGGHKVLNKSLMVMIRKLLNEYMVQQHEKWVNKRIGKIYLIYKTCLS